MLTPIEVCLNIIPKAYFPTESKIDGGYIKSVMGPKTLGMNAKEIQGLIDEVKEFRNDVRNWGNQKLGVRVVMHMI
jgi:hypothetical protein